MCHDKCALHSTMFPINQAAADLKEANKATLHSTMFPINRKRGTKMLNCYLWRG